MITPILLAAAQALTFTADRVAVDNVTKAAAATGHVVAAVGPLTLRSESLLRDVDGAYIFNDPTCVTTCTNAPGHLHWSATAAYAYREADSVTVRNLRLRLFEIPVFWFPFLWYPLETDCGFSWMPGYMGSWGAYLLTKYRYHLLGDPEHQETTWWLYGATRFDLRYRQGAAVGEDFKWNLGDFGTGLFKSYYAADEDINRRYRHTGSNANWESPVKRDRYAFEFNHRWEATERDSVLLRAAYYSDSQVRSDFFRRTFFNAKTQWLSIEGNGVYWEHLENAFAVGAELSGPLNKFYGMTGRAPEVYFDVHPLPLWGLPINYETQNRIGYLTRDYSELSPNAADNVYAYRPGMWAEYEAFRFDTYHRLTAPFKVADVLSVVPRIGYHGTHWSNGGPTDLTGASRAGTLGHGGMYRSILEGGTTFSGRATGWIDEIWQHMSEPYLDVLAQEAWYDGAGGGMRPYVFDNIDASMVWEDQFAGRSRNLPYSYYGITPGWRNVWRELDAHGKLQTVLDVDVYAAMQFNRTKHLGANEKHVLSEPGYPNYGKHTFYTSPGTRVRWTPDDDIMLGMMMEYDPDYNQIARSELTFRQKVSDKFKYDFGYSLRDYRYWDFSSSPYNARRMRSDVFNDVSYGTIRAGWEHEIVDWLAWGPYAVWDTKRNELDVIGTWVDYLTDCLGFRFLVEYEENYTCVDGERHSHHWNFGFYIYLRCFSSASSNIFTGF